MEDKELPKTGASQGVSRVIYTNQHGIHENLAKLVRKHLATEFRKPPAKHTVRAFNDISEQIAVELMPLILDSGCGTGYSSRQIAKQHPEHWVIGLDRSKKRLNKEEQDPVPTNCLIVQADCIDFWKLAVKAGWQLDKHFLLYPNPYPKSVQLKYRWHAHPAFADLLKLGGLIEVRSNWEIYIQEFKRALEIADQQASDCEAFNPTKGYLTLFERKYHHSGQTLYRCLSQISL